MYISQIELCNWKQYKDVKLEFPAPTTDANIVLIGGLNGFGKTSLFQAILLSMFGEDGMTLIGKSAFSEPQTGREVSYKAFLESALHSGSSGNGHSHCSVKIVFVDDDEDVIEISRIWHFKDFRSYLPHDEEIQIYKGRGREAIGPNGLSSQERKEWYGDYIARNFLPHNLASFFVFDGEKVSELAALEMASQVRLGIEGLLGIPELRGLSKNLKDYATHRKRDVPNITDHNINKMTSDLESMNVSLAKKIERKKEIHTKLVERKEEREQLQKELESLGTGAQPQSKLQYSQLTKYDAAIRDENDQLEKLLSQDIALALAGSALRKQLKKRLSGENIREEWLAGKQQGDSRIDAFLSTIDDAMDTIEPPIKAKQQEEILSIARVAWEDLWYPPPKGCADDYLHYYFSAHERSNVIDQLNALDQLGTTKIVDLLNSISKNENKHKQIRDEIFRLEAATSAPDVVGKFERLKELNPAIEVLTKEDVMLGREREGLDGQINAKNAELARIYARQDDARPAMRRVAGAHAVAAMVDQIVKKSVPSQTAAIANEMTKAHKSMSHKIGLIERIDIDEQCDVKLLNSTGEDVRHKGLSAGERQIFTQSLFSAVSAVSKHSFPMVVDTPLARLDDKHRKGVLRHLSQLGRQVILLSTNTEVVNEYLAEIEVNIQKKYLISYVSSEERSEIVEGYFDDVEPKI